MRQIIDALDAVHEQGIAHRDLKPASIDDARRGFTRLERHDFEDPANLYYDVRR